jgi:hypothetical protein
MSFHASCFTAKPPTQFYFKGGGHICIIQNLPVSPFPACVFSRILNNADLTPYFGGMLRVPTHPEEGSCKQEFIRER